MSELRALLGKLGLQDAQSLLQSGNLLFRAAESRGAYMEQLLEEATEKHVGLRTDFFVRTAEEWRSMIDANPFPAEAERDPGHLVMMALKAAPGRTAVKALQDAIPGRELVNVEGRHAYFYYPDGIGRSKLTNVLVEKKLDTRGTGRNWNTVLKLGARSERQ